MHYQHFIDSLDRVHDQAEAIAAEINQQAMQPKRKESKDKEHKDLSRINGDHIRKIVAFTKKAAPQYQGLRPGSPAVKLPNAKQTGYDLILARTKSGEFQLILNSKRKAINEAGVVVKDPTIPKLRGTFKSGTEGFVLNSEKIECVFILVSKSPEIKAEIKAKATPPSIKFGKE